MTSRSKIEAIRSKTIVDGKQSGGGSRECRCFEAVQYVASGDRLKTAGDSRGEEDSLHSRKR